LAQYGLHLTAEMTEKVLAGVPVLEIASVPGADKLEAGRPLRFLDPRGMALGSGFADPENDVVRILSFQQETFEPGFFKKRVRAALMLRKSLGLVTPENSYRLINAEGDGLGGFTADIFGDYASLWVYSRALMNYGRLIAQAIIDVAGIKGVVLKIRPKGGVKPGQIKQEVVGEEPPEKLIVKEMGIPFEVHLMGGLNVGLFTDMREHRQGLRRFVRGARVLNTFCYTGALSVAAARFGAASVTSVDLSSGVLKWGMANFRLSGLNPEDPRYVFETSDVIRFMEKEVDRKAQYDSIILDPPTYSAARSSAWSMKNDYPDLIALSARLIPEEQGGFIWVSANTHKSKGVVPYILEGIKKAKRQAQIIELGGLPPDYPTPAAWEDGRYLEVCQLHILPEL